MKKSTKVRVTMDFVIEFPQFLPCAPSFGVGTKRALLDLITDGFRKSIMELGGGEILPGAHIGFRLDLRKCATAYEQITLNGRNFRAKKEKKIGASVKSRRKPG